MPTRSLFRLAGPRALLASALSLGLVLASVRASSEPGLAARNDQFARGKKGAVVSASPEASAVGLGILKQGGNAVDAAVATAFALAVTHPQAGNLGGGGFLIFHGKDGKSFALDFREMAPKRAHRDLYLDKNGKVIAGASLWTSLAVGVPGSVKGLLDALEHWGTLKREQVLAPAIRLARDGFPVPHFLHRAIVAKQKIFAQWPATAAIFLPGGKALETGTLLVQKDLAATLIRISKDGAKGFYSGSTAKDIVRAVEKGGGIISLSDLAAYRSVLRKPVVGEYRGHKILSMPPPSSGGVALIEMLNMVERFQVREMGLGSARTMHLMIEVMKRAYSDRARWLGDSDYYPVPVDGLIRKDYAEARLENYDPEKADHHVRAGRPLGAPKEDDGEAPRRPREESRETTHFSVLDASGNAVSCTTTLNSSFGNGQVVAGAGFFLNNEMDDFSAKAGVPNQFGLVGAKANEIAAGKRPLSSMTPTIVLDKTGKRPLLVLGSPGGGRIINTVFQVILDVLDHELSLREAVAAPRIHHQWLPRDLYWERLALGTDLRRDLAAMGHRFRKRPTKSIGRCQAILLKADGSIEAASDPRSPGTASAW